MYMEEVEQDVSEYFLGSDGDDDDEDDPLEHDVIAFSFNFVENILEQAIVFVNKLEQSNDRGSLQLLVFSPQDYDNNNITQTAIKGISNFITHWKLEKRKWKFVVKPFQQWKNEVEGGEERETFVFQAIFSTPHRRMPTPQGTANVYFVFDIDKRHLHVNDEPVCVAFNYQFEGMTYLYEANCKRIHFQEEMLCQIIDTKLELFRQLDY